MTELLTKELSENLGTKIRIRDVSITFINRFQLQQVYVEDLEGDTLLFSEKIKVTINKFRREKKEIGFSKISLSNASVHLISRGPDGINLQFIIDKLSRPEKNDTSAWNISLARIQLNNSRFRYSNPADNDQKSPINYSEMDLSNLNTRVSNLAIQEGIVTFRINHLEFIEKSGFVVSNINSRFSIAKSHMYFDNIYIETPFSRISANEIHFDFKTFKDFSDFVNLVELSSSFRSSVLSFKDLSYFSYGLTSFNETFRISGNISGTISDLKAKKILVSYNDHTMLGGNLNLIGLPEISETFIHFDMEMFQTNMKDIQNIHLPGDKKLSLPENLDSLGIISYTGKFTGYLDDFVAFGMFGSDLGNISTDLLLEPDGKGGLNYQGNISTSSFSLGSIIPGSNHKIGKISISATVDGHAKKQTLSADLTGKIDSIQLYGYTYKNINLAGFLSDKTFDGSFNITDPNIQMEFLGKVDFSKNRPNFNFTADVGRLRPYFLNINKSDPSYFASFLLKSDFSGFHPDSIEGRIDLVNSFFQRTGDQIQVYDFSLIAENKDDSSSLRIRSEIMDADIKGHYHFSNVLRSVKNVVSHYIPSFGTEIPSESKDFIDDNNFEYSLHLKEAENVVRFFTRDVKLANNSTLSGFYRPADHMISATGSFPYLGFRENHLSDLEIRSGADSTNAEFLLSSSHFKLKNDLSLDNFKVSGEVYRDTLKTNLAWDSYAKPVYKGNLNLLANFSNNLLTGNQRVEWNILPSDFIFNDSLWTISPTRIVFDSSNIKVDTLHIGNQKHSFIVYGEISEKPGSVLGMNFNDLDLNTLNVFTRKLKLDLAGSLNGEARLINAYKNPLFLSDLTMNDFFINGQSFGQGELRANYNNASRSVHILSSGTKAESEIFRIEGDFHPIEKSLDFDIAFDKIRLSAVEPFAESLISELKGLGTGQLELSGTTDKPELNGTISFFKSSLLVDYLQTRYFFTDVVRISKNNIYLENFTLTDELGNTAIAKGKISSDYFKTFYLGLNITTSEFLFLDTKPKDNELFHGRVLASGYVNISGEPDNLFMDITAKSGRNSVFNIPLYGAEEVNTIDFIQFVDNTGESRENNDEQNYEVNLRGLNLSFNLEITPDAEVQLIFDPKVGDILRGRGNGNLTMSINSLGKFEMFGEMVIVDGDYLFTLQNLINKKLEVIPGGRITWNGDPEDANIDLKAVYKLRTSVYALSPEPGEAGEKLKTRIPVECQINMTGKLMEPTIATDIYLPTADQETRNRVSAAISTEEEKLKQFISLLVINNFMSVDPGNSFLTGASSVNTANMAGVATSELLSNQLSHWLSQISKDFDIGLNYRPGDQITSDELEVALSTQILNERVTISGNLDVGGNTATQASSTTNTNNIAGDFDIDFKITENGKLHLKAFNRANDNLLFQTSPYTQGVGVFYREDFNTFGELLRRYRDAILRLFSNSKEQDGETSMNR